MGELMQGMKVDANAPKQTRFPVKFLNWDRSGYVIAPDKLASDAKMFRDAARLLRSHPDNKGQPNPFHAHAGALENMADQWEAAVTAEAQ